MNRRWLAISFSFVLLQAYVHEAPAQERPGVETYDNQSRLVASVAQAVHEALAIRASAAFASTSSTATTSLSAPCSSTHHRVGFNGYFFDCTVGLYYTPSSRWYDPETGRFLQEDSYLGDVVNPPSLHRYTFGHNNPTSFVDPTGHESYRQWLGLDNPTPHFWTEFGKNVAYRSFNFVSLGTLGRQDTLVEQYERGRIGEGGYWLKTAGNAATSGAVLVAATATGGTAAGFAGGLGASATTSAVVGGATAGITAQATSDLSEVALLGTKSLEDVSATDYAVAGTLGGVAGGALSKAGSLGADLNPSLPSLGALDNPVTSGLARGIEATAQYAYQGGANAARSMVVAEGLDGNGVLVPAKSGGPASSARARFPRGIDPAEGTRITESIRRSLQIEGRNVAIAEATINGERELLTAVSGKASPRGTVAARSERLFTTRSSGAMTRAFDSEVKLLENLGQRLPANATGTVSLFTERATCPSCAGVIQQFEQRFPGVKVIVTNKP